MKHQPSHLSDLEDNSNITSITSKPFKGYVFFVYKGLNFIIKSRCISVITQYSFMRYKISKHIWNCFVKNIHFSDYVFAQLIKFGCDANMRSIREEELFKICAGSFMTWCNPNCDVTFSNAFPWEVLLSLQYQNFDFALKSLIATRRKGFFRDKVSKFNSKLSINVSKFSVIG